VGFRLARELLWHPLMTNSLLYGAMGATGAPATSVLVTIDGGLVTAVGLAGLCIGGVLFVVAFRQWRSRRRFVVRPLAMRRAAV
jgi:hypothetical protein